MEAAIYHEVRSMEVNACPIIINNYVNVHVPNFKELMIPKLTQIMQ